MADNKRLAAAIRLEARARAERDAARAELAAANARADANCEAWVAESKRHVETADEVAALSARLERVRALADDPIYPEGDDQGYYLIGIADFDAALGEDT